MFKSMAAIIFTTSILLGATHSLAEVVKQEMPACISEDLLNEITKYIMNSDKESYMPLLRSGQCIRLDPGMNVSVIEVRFFASTTIRYKGIKLHTHAKAIQ